MHTDVTQQDGCASVVIRAAAWVDMSVHSETDGMEAESSGRASESNGRAAESVKMPQEFPDNWK